MESVRCRAWSRRPSLHHMSDAVVENIRSLAGVLRCGQYWAWVHVRALPAEHGLTAFDVAAAESTEAWGAELGVIATRQGDAYAYVVSRSGQREWRCFDAVADLSLSREGFSPRSACSIPPATRCPAVRTRQTSTNWHPAGAASGPIRGRHRRGGTALAGLLPSTLRRQSLDEPLPSRAL